MGSIRSVLSISGTIGQSESYLALDCMDIFLEMLWYWKPFTIYNLIFNEILQKLPLLGKSEVSMQKKQQPI